MQGVSGLDDLMLLDHLHCMDYWIDGVLLSFGYLILDTLLRVLRTLFALQFQDTTALVTQQPELSDMMFTDYI